MASYEITADVETLVATGLTEDQIIAISGLDARDLHLNIWRGEVVEAFVRARAAQAKWNTFFADWTEEQEAAQEETTEATTQDAPATAEAAPRATDKQVAFIMKLIRQGKHLEGGYYTGPTTHEGVAGMSRESASRYIDSLLGNH